MATVTLILVHSLCLLRTVYLCPASFHSHQMAGVLQSTGSTGPVLHFVESPWADIGIQQNFLTVFLELLPYSQAQTSFKAVPFITAS